MNSAFNIAAGFTVFELSFLIRVFFASVITLWAGWVVYKQFLLFSEDRMKLGTLGGNYIKLVLVWTFLMLLIVT
jgi:hypothetical protein